MRGDANVEQNGQEWAWDFIHERVSYEEVQSPSNFFFFSFFLARGDDESFPPLPPLNHSSSCSRTRAAAP